MKKILKKIPFLNKIVQYIKFKKEFLNDYSFFKKNYINNKMNKDKIEYALLLEIHKLEKGMSCETIRPFGKDKVKEIIRLLSIDKSNISFATNYAYNILNEYIKIYENNNWTTFNEYKMVKEFLNQNKNYKKENVGFQFINFDDIKDDLNIDYMKFLKSRHSVRNFQNKKIKKKDIKSAVEMAIQTPSACNRQMCKIYYMDSEKSAKLVKDAAQGIGLFKLEGINYFVVTFDVSANYFIGERNQGWFNAGLFSMNFVNALHSLEIGSCFIQFGNTFKEEKILKEELRIPSSERIAVIIAAGYYDKISKIPKSKRKDFELVYYER